MQASFHKRANPALSRVCFFWLFFKVSLFYNMLLVAAECSQPDLERLTVSAAEAVAKAQGQCFGQCGVEPEGLGFHWCVAGDHSL